MKPNSRTRTQQRATNEKVSEGQTRCRKSGKMADLSSMLSVRWLKHTN